jgi:hypothetical protein
MRRALAGHERTRRGVRLEFREADEIERVLSDFIRREKECCPFFEFELGWQAGALVLQIDAPDAAAPLLDEIHARARRTVARARGED